MLELTGVFLNKTTSNKKRIFSIPELSPLFPQEVKDVQIKGGATGVHITF